MRILYLYTFCFILNGLFSSCSDNLIDTGPVFSVENGRGNVRDHGYISFGIIQYFCGSGTCGPEVTLKEIKCKITKPVTDTLHTADSILIINNQIYLSSDIVIWHTGYNARFIINGDTTYIGGWGYKILPLNCSTVYPFKMEYFQCP